MQPVLPGKVRNELLDLLKANYAFSQALNPVDLGPEKFVYEVLDGWILVLNNDKVGFFFPPTGKPISQYEIAIELPERVAKKHSKVFDTFLSVQTLNRRLEHFELRRTTEGPQSGQNYPCSRADFIFEWVLPHSRRVIELLLNKSDVVFIGLRTAIGVGADSFDDAWIEMAVLDYFAIGPIFNQSSKAGLRQVGKIQMIEQHLSAVSFRVVFQPQGTFQYFANMVIERAMDSLSVGQNVLAGREDEPQIGRPPNLSQELK
jgi:hypothetical protein